MQISLCICVHVFVLASSSIMGRYSGHLFQLWRSDAVGVCYNGDVVSWAHVVTVVSCLG